MNHACFWVFAQGTARIFFLWLLSGIFGFGCRNVKQHFFRNNFPFWPAWMVPALLVLRLSVPRSQPEGRKTSSTACFLSIVASGTFIIFRSLFTLTIAADVFEVQYTYTHSHTVEQGWNFDFQGCLRVLCNYRWENNRKIPDEKLSNPTLRSTRGGL